ncbi:MAG TPA: hypothetical protein DEB09_01155 [Candidatus Magasanikbacteria bacterium]|nr:hypothetical protein [Candidatus Magasanikbacteria bacterium]
MERKFSLQPEFGKEINKRQTDLELNLAMMETMGGAQIYGDKPNVDPDDVFIDKILEQVDRPERLGPTN